MGLGWIFLIAFVCAFMLLAQIPDQAEARKPIEDIGIVLSKNCLTMLKNNFTTNCPTYEELMILHPDKSDQKISGKFAISEGIYQRQHTIYKHHFEFYTFEDPVIWIDPPGDIRKKIKIITIENNLNEYKLRETYANSHKMEENTLVLGEKRYIDRCLRAIINGADWITLVGDTIHYMNNDCKPGFTNFDHVKKMAFEYYQHDRTTTYKYFLDNWIAESKIKCKGLCFEY